MTSTPKSGKYVQENDSASPSPLAGSGPGGHKPSFKSTKLARRARSFKDDFLGKISQMRSPAGTGLRSHSPKSTSNVGGAAGVPSTTAIIGGVAGVSKSDMGGDMHGFHMPPQKGPIHELDDLCKQIQIALKHFRDVVSKQILEMLPGNGTVVLDTVWHINLAVKSSVEAENSSSITSATNHMYQSVARLIKLCDDILLDNKSSELDANNVNEIVNQVEDAVKNLIQLAQEKISNQQQQINYKTTPRSYGNTSLEMPAQRNSLPDIPLTPREREILENTSCITPAMVRSSHSTESILRDSSPPPPKPPLPDSICRTTVDAPSFVTPPPLPPKKKSGSRQTHTPRSNIHHHHHHDDFNNSNVEMSPGVLTSLERISLRSKSPEDSISLRSESAGSIDSMLNHSSREEDEIKALMDGDPDYDLHRTADIFVANGSNSWEESSLSSSISNNNNEYQTSVNDYHRLSNADSGFVSFRSSNYSKRSSQQSSISSSQFVTKHSSNSEMVKSESIVQNLNKTETQLSLKKASTSSTSSTSSFTVLSNSQQSMSCGLRQDELDFLNTPDDSSVPPAIPQKTRRKTQERQPSPYDNVPDDSLGAELLVTCQMHQSHQSLSSSTSISSSSIVQQDSTKPPPLPPKKKHIMAYMEMFGNCSHTNDQEFMRHSVHMVQQSSHWTPPPTLVPALPTTQSCSFNHTQSSLSSRSSHTQIQSLTTASHSSGIDRIPSPLHSPSHFNNNHMPTVTTIPPALPPKQRSRKGSAKTSPPTTPSYTITAPTSNSGDIKRAQSPPKVLPDLLEHTATTTATPTVTTTEDKPKTADVNPCDIDLMDELNVDKYLVLKKPEEDAPDIRGGPIDALIIQATKATRNGVFTYQEAFLTTYRTFITPDDLITKLIRRYNHFYYQPDKKPRSREAFALIVRVVSDLTVSDLEVHLQLKLMNFVQQLISCGELTLAKALRVKHLERHGAKKMAASINILNVTQTISLTPRDVTLLSFKSEQIAEQMTLLDAELFMKIEIPEVLIWAQEQNEERSPNLTRFTEHFNKMSYWARTKLLQAETKDIREKYFLKFIKVMKHLRKINNFNSYLALLSALDSAPIRRLEWQKHVQEGLKEYCALIDSSSSFRAYRQALAETQPPCIPYIGLVLQDLTFVHIGNSNLLPNGSINFTKRWQQFNIVENMKKFKKSSYTFKKNEKIIDFFSNFNDCMCEDAMWQMSETIKPRGGKKPTNQ